ncbi:DUF6479 family protein [Streptomyces sp. NPDC056367]|uniref:DUF6479 family protein n=1 Tax=Streptomyces sp. NPDC056367 TaxID=3345797 RepID=UPI0035E2E2A9
MLWVFLWVFLLVGVAVVAFLLIAFARGRRIQARDSGPCPPPETNAERTHRRPVRPRRGERGGAGGRTRRQGRDLNGAVCVGQVRLSPERGGRP